MMAKVLIDVPEFYRWLLDYRLTLIHAEDTIDLEKSPQIPILTLSFMRTPKAIEGIQKDDDVPPV